jgi:hypothetical protein
MRRTFLPAVMIFAVLIGLNATATTPTQTPALDRLMREKLAHSQKILEAVVTSDWKTLERESRAVQQLTKEPAWRVLMTPEYVRHTGTFIRALDELISAAEAHDLDATPLAYTALTLSCVQCHRYVARARIAVR